MFLLNLGRTCWYASWGASSTVIPSFWNSFFASLKVDSNLDVHERSLMPLHTLSSSSSSSVLFWLSELLLSSSSSSSSSSLSSSSLLSPSSAMLSCSSELSRSSEASVPWSNDSSESASLWQFSQGVVQCQKRLADVLGPINREPSSHSLQLPGWITAVWIAG